MATSGTIYGAKVKSWYLKIDWERTEVSIENNQSTIKASLYVYNNNTAYNNYANEAYYTIDGTKTYAKFSFPSTKAWRLLGTKTFTITHDNDGSKKYTLSGYWYSGVISSSYTPESLSVSGTIALDTIPRKATVSKVTSFNDDGNPTITFTNLGGFNLAPYINIYQDETIIHKISRTKGEFTSPYTFSLTDAERTALRNACNSKNEYDVTIGVNTYNGDTLLDYDSLWAKLTIVNANPTFDASLISFKDTNSKVVGITGNDQTIVQNKSTLSVTCGAATAYKGATISKYEVTLNGVTKSITTASGGTVSMGAVAKDGDLKISVKVTDSRGNSVTKEKAITIIPYSKPILATHSSYGQIVCERCDANGVIDKSGKYLKLIIQGKWYSLKSGENSATVDVQITAKDYESSWINVPATVLGGGSANGYMSWIDINTKVNGVTFELTKAYVVTIRCIDEFGTASDETTYTDLSYKIPTDSVALHLGKGGNKAAFGKYAEYDKVLDLAEDWDLMMKGQTVRDFIVEEGTSGIWTYHKWHSGIVDCWGTYSCKLNQTAGTSYSTTDYISYPFTFKEIHSIQGTISGGYLVDLKIDKTTTTQCRFLYWIENNDTLVNVPQDLYISVKGTWK